MKIDKKAGMNETYMDKVGKERKKFSLKIHDKKMSNFRLGKYIWLNNI